MRGQGFSQNELTSLLDLVERHLPISARDWEVIATSHLVYYPDRKRTAESCQRKFNSLCNTKPRTGETQQHPTVEQAKAIGTALIQELAATMQKMMPLWRIFLTTTLTTTISRKMVL
jgi:hypothetical protein